MCEFAYNERIHRSIECSLFLTLYNEEYKIPMTLSIPNLKYKSVNKMIREMNEFIEFVKLSMKNAQDRIKHYANKKRNFRVIDDNVFLKFIPK